MLKVLKVVSGGLLLAIGGCGVGGDVDEQVTEERSALAADGNDYGVAETFHTSGTLDFTNPFAQPLGTNPRTCITCHAPDQGWTMTAEANKRLFKDTDGLAPLFNLVDEGTRPDSDISTKQLRKQVFATTVTLAVTRFTRTIPVAGEFTVAPEDPSGFSDSVRVLNFRRPTASANQTKVSSILNTAGSPQDIPATDANLMNGAAGLHEQRDVVNNPVPTDQRNAGRDFMLGIFFAQIKDYGAGRLDVGGAMGGPTNLSTFPFTLGMNDPIGSPATFNRKVFNIYDAWAPYAVNNRHNDCEGDAKAAIYRGQEIFNFLEFDITGVPGFNDVVGQTTYRGTCSTCHNTPNVGGHSVIRMMDIGTAEESVCNELFPVLAVTNKTTGATRRLCDMGRGGNGVWADLAKFRVPPLRGLAARMPVFHDGQAKNIKQAIKFHEERFNIDLSHGRRKDLEAFLGAL
jgi:cytochrome c peroxidase